MKPFHAILVSAACLALGACSIKISDDGIDRSYRDYEHSDRITVTLPNGDRDRFTCPEGTTSFVLNHKDEGLGMAYGCRTNGTPIPTIDSSK